MKEALENNICIICGEKNCPYIKNKRDYQNLINPLKSGNLEEAKKVYRTKCSPLRRIHKAEVMKGLQKAREARNSGVCTAPYTGPIQHKRAIATPGLWSEWIELLNSIANESSPNVYTVNFNPSSNLELSFDVEIKYPEANGVNTPCSGRSEPVESFASTVVLLMRYAHKPCSLESYASLATRISKSRVV